MPQLWRKFRLFIKPYEFGCEVAIDLRVRLPPAFTKKEPGPTRAGLHF